MTKRPQTDPEPGLADPFSENLGYQLRRASQALMADLGAELEPRGVSIVEASVLLVILDNPGITQSEIGRLLNIHRANVAPIAAKLATLKLTRTEQVGRRRRLEMTTRGRRLAEAARSAMDAHEIKHFGHLREAERARLLRWLESLWRDEGVVGVTKS